MSATYHKHFFDISNRLFIGSSRLVWSTVSTFKTSFGTHKLGELVEFFSYCSMCITFFLYDPKYGNGGPIILVQVENEYGSFACDKNYSRWLRDLTDKHVENKAALFTNDGPPQLPCGKIDNVLATLDFGSGMKLRRKMLNWMG